jgi:hypothetical protein
VKTYDNVPIIKKQISYLNNNNILYKILENNQFIGCMGCCLAITKVFLTQLEVVFKISNLKDNINNQTDAIAFERTIAIMCFALNNTLKNDVSFEGDIKDMVWGYSYKDFINDKKISKISKKLIIKIFGART